MTTQNIINTTLSSQTGTGKFVGDTSSTLVTPTSLGVQQQALNMNSHKITSVTDPTSAQDAATKNYVDTVAAGLNPATSVNLSTTASSDTSGLTYNNGVSGIGATFTGSTNTALTFDGVTLTSLNQRVLVKNDTQSPSGAFNGIYYLTQLQTALLPPILTRALDYDQPSDINNTGIIPVISGNTLAGTGWYQTATVVTVGTTPLTFIQFGGGSGTVNSGTSGQLAFYSATGTAVSGETTITKSQNGVTMVQKTGSGGGNYTTTSGSYVAVDSTNLAYTVTVPTGYKLYITASGSSFNTVAGSQYQISLYDNATSTRLTELALNATGNGYQLPFSTSYILTGDGASHTIYLEYLAVAATTGMINGSATATPFMTFLLMPSN